MTYSQLTLRGMAEQTKNVILQMEAKHHEAELNIAVNEALAAAMAKVERGAKSADHRSLVEAIQKLKLDRRQIARSLEVLRPIYEAEDAAARAAEPAEEEHDDEEPAVTAELLDDEDEPTVATAEADAATLPALEAPHRNGAGRRRDVAAAEPEAVGAVA